MKLVRPVAESDLNDLLMLAEKAGTGLTTLPMRRQAMKDKLQKSIDSFSANPKTPGDEYYFFVEEDLESGHVIGCSAIDAMVGLKQPFYSFKISRFTKYSKTFNVKRTIKFLSVVNDYEGASEICTLYVLPKYRKQYNGKLISLSRFFYIANEPERFSNIFIAEMRGVSDKEGYSPFWQGLGQHFFEVDFPQADYLTGIGQKQFIYDLMPRFPVYVDLLPEFAQKVIGVPHKNTVSAKKMLEREGFAYNGYIDIFDAGPTVKAHKHQIHTVNDSQVLTIDKINTHVEHEVYMLSTTTQPFRACVAPAIIHDDHTVHLHQDASRVLQLGIGDDVRIVDIRRKNV